MEKGEGPQLRTRGIVDINRHYDGSKGWFKGFRYRNPTLYDVEKIGPITPVPEYHHRDALNRETFRPRDLARYISPTFGKPFHMLVQAAQNAQAQGEWRRRAVTGNAPVLLRVATWAIGNEVVDAENIAIVIGRSILVMPAIFFLVAYPMGGTMNSAPTYPSFPSRCYEYPKHALNSLDAAPDAPTTRMGVKRDDKDRIYNVTGEQERLLRPRALVVKQHNQWNIVEDGSYTGPYIFMSFAAHQFQIPAPTIENPEHTITDKESIDLRASSLAEHMGVSAYWVDYHCRAEEQPGATDDVHRFCDVVRGALKVCVILPNSSRHALVLFGQRLWCLPEVLLARGHEVLICTPEIEGQDNTETVNIMEMVFRAWAVRITEENDIVSDGNEEIFRLIAEHYTGTLKLSRLELIQVALAVLRSRSYHEFQNGDIAYALMTLLSKRPRMDPTDSEQQALARLSLANDSDKIVERMACLDQTRVNCTPESRGWFNFYDTMGANLWDIDPLCQVAGVCHDGSIILDGCHGVAIRWKNIPRIYVVKRKTWKKALAAMALRSGPFWFLIGICLAPIKGPYTGAGAFFLVLGILLLVTAPWSVATLYGGKVWGAKPWLIGFEGTLPIREVERLTFGNAIGRFTYTPSSGPYCSRQRDERIGADPSINFQNLPDGYRLFTLIDTGTMTVTVFAAVRPPSVALICGKEGGMLRVLLCSYERSTNAFQKECVLRMETPMWDQSQTMGWVKLI